METKQIVIKLDVVNIDRDNNTNWQYTVGYYSSYEIVEKVMPTLFVVRDEALFLTEEIQVDTIIGNEDYYKDYVTRRQYRWVGEEIKMIHETPYNFNGYKDESEYQYKVGDIIEYIYGGDNIGVSIVGATPPKYNEEMCFDYIDDSYLVYDLGDGDTHDHIPTCNIIGLANVKPDEYKAYKDKLKERMKLWENNNGE